MKTDKIFLASKARTADFEFNAEVAEVFDDMVARSVRLYEEQEKMVTAIGKDFCVPDTNVYDLGCSTATTLIRLCPELPPSVHLIGYDNSAAMLEQARHKIAENHFQERIELRLGDLNGELSHVPLTNASVVTKCWTLQFIRPLHRDRVIRWIYDALVDEGVLVVTEKILTNNGDLNRFFVESHHDFKRPRGSSVSDSTRQR